MYKVFRLTVTDSTANRILPVANTIHNLSDVYFAHPIFSQRPEPFGYMVYDYYNNYQDHIKKIIGDFNNATAWDFTRTDDSIIVALLDAGIEVHEDLPSDQIIDGYDFYDDDYDLSLEEGDTLNHGMWCAGILTAKHTTDSLLSGDDSTGIISVAPNITILNVKVGRNNGKFVDITTMTEAVNYARLNGADILSCSWGNRYGIQNPEMNMILDEAFYKGRDGKGCVLIFASGNFAYSYPGIVAYPANYWCTFAVGATDIDDTIFYWSQYGDEIDIVAPLGESEADGAVWTLDRMGEAGSNSSTSGNDCPTSVDNDIDYHCGFSGTSAACPMVAGTAALVLSRYPDISATAVYNILRNSAVTDLDWGTITPPDTLYGWGRVDAFRAVLAVARGDNNNSGSINVVDASYMINYIYNSGPEPAPDYRVGDANCDGYINITDASYIINYIFYGGAEPPICFEYDY